jgi:3-oxoacyl-[acyl-carrier-protein] synthase I
MSITALKEDSIYIVGAGAQTPVGRNMLAAAAAVRCGISAYAEHPSIVDEWREPMVVARAEWLAESLPLPDRIVTLAIDAAREALQPLGNPVSSLRRRVRMHLALSAESLPDDGQRQGILERLAIGSAFAALGPEIELVVDGNAGGLLALKNAVLQLRRGDVQLCLVGGADSWLDAERLKAIDAGGRLHSVHCTWGFTPGEGAGFCLIATGSTVRTLDLTPFAEILAVATAQESMLLGTDTVCVGEGLTRAFQAVLNPHHRVAHSYCDLNGETYRAEEYGFAVCRTSDSFENAGSFTAGAECWGDVGAASSPLAITLALAAWSRGYAKGPVTLAWSSSASRPLRAAALLGQCDQCTG